MKKAIIFSSFLMIAFNCCIAQTTATFTINTTSGSFPISPYIYGINSDVLLPADSYRSFRLGGTRMNSYNWENNASNAGADYFDYNDNYLCTWQGVSNCALPAQAIINFYNRAKNYHAYSLVTLPMAGYVSADKASTSVTSTQTAPSSRWVATQDVKGTAFATTPNLADGKVYLDEEINYLVTQLGNAASGGINAYGLTNEAGIWPTQTSRLHPTQTGAAEVLNRSVSLAGAVKNADASAEIFGGNFYGFGEYYNMQGAADWAALKATNAGYRWYVDYYLDKMKAASTTANKRLMDVLSFHWYPEATGDHRIANPNAYTANDKSARLQAPRSLWDNSYATYTTTPPYASGENSYISQYFGAGSSQVFLPLIPKIQQSVGNWYPGTKIAFGEYNFGGGNDITGGIAQADVLGIFGKYKVYYSNYWDTYGEVSFISPAFQLYTNYDGLGKMFGNTSISASTSDVANTSVYASTNNGNDAVLHIMAINKSAQPVTATFNITSLASYSLMQVWQLDAGSTSIVRKADQTVGGSSFTYTLPSLSVIHFVTGTPISLPVNFLYVAATAVADNAVQVKWATASESNTSHYLIARSSDGINFTTMGRVAAGHNQAGTQTYSFDDIHPLSNKSYYRLVISGLDGLTTNSNIVSVYRPKSNMEQLTVLSNPAGAVLSFIIKGDAGSTYTTRLINSFGTLVYSGNAVADEKLQVSIPQFAKGIYILQAMNQQTGSIQQQRVLIQ